jgi:DNA-binding beta-propeller fold protein YncE
MKTLFLSTIITLAVLSLLIAVHSAFAETPTNIEVIKVPINFVRDVSVDNQGNIYIAYEMTGEVGEAKLAKLDKQDKLLWSIPIPGDCEFSLATNEKGKIFTSLNAICLFDNNGTLLSTFNPFFTYGEPVPFRIAIDSQDRIYAAIFFTHSIRVFDQNGTMLREFGSKGTSDAQFTTLSDIAVGPNDTIYALDKDNPRIQVFDNSGHFLFKFGQNGTGDSKLINPMCIDTDPLGKIYVTDVGNVKIFDSKGNFISDLVPNGQIQPACAFVDNNEKVYVVEGLAADNFIEVFDSKGNLLSYIGQESSFNQTGSSVPEFPFVTFVLVVSIISLFVFLRIKPISFVSNP